MTPLIVDLGLADEGVARSHAPGSDLDLEVLGHEAAAVILAQLDTTGGVAAEMAGLIPARVDHDASAQSRRPMDRIRQGWFMSSFQASQQWATMSS